MAFLDQFRIQDVTFDALPESLDLPEASVLHPTRSALVRSGELILGVIGELHPSVARDFDLDSRLALAEFDVALLLAARQSDMIFTPLQKFPYAIRDISLTFPSTVGKRVTVREVELLLREAGAPLLSKPFTPAALAREVRAVLDGTR